ncbi:MAG TPA: protease complex subunit PrcB family protein [Candidatus Polarisedimenticolaceae bacterium]|nr:protease complex subunit PrcB family protein [Candidatus Polarisedimenticolaceae bacterium]
MARKLWLLAVGAVLLLPVCRAESARASRMWIVGWEAERASVVTGEAAPVEFTLSIAREMPTPGWRLEVDAVEIDAGAHRIAVRVTERGPAGIVAQVITETPFEIPLGPIEPGSYFVEIWARPSSEVAHQPAHALVVRAR